MRVPKRLGLIEADELPPELAREHRSYGWMFRRLLNAAGARLEYRHYQATELQLPEHLNACDAYLITGSKAGVYEPWPWVEALVTWIRQAHRSEVPLIGVCFGHQVIAEALGGHAARSDRGWGLGVARTAVLQHPPWVSQPPESVALMYSHQDQVLALPPYATPWLGNNFCPLAGYWIDESVFAMQGHPEFTPEYLRALVLRRADRIGATEVKVALASLHQPTAHKQVARWMLAFIERR